ncbi:MAG: nodulation protein NfeD [Rubrivivax sp.]|nr:nodulation protein NfeD [Rubrivivax sp.]
MRRLASVVALSLGIALAWLQVAGPGPAHGAAPAARASPASQAAAGARSEPASAAAGAPVIALQLHGAIGPVSADLVRRAIERAGARGAQLVVLMLDTPGGLDTAMRDIIRTVLAAPVPVAGFVSPQGARAASAGTYILYACHVAAMAPATNLGAATPIAVGLPMPGGAPPGTAPPPKAPASAASGTGGERAEPQDALTAKRVHDAAAYLRGLAQLRGRNAQWAERAVREAVSLSATEAQAQQVVDLVAADLPELLRRLDGRRLQAGGKELVLATAGAPVEMVQPDWRGRLLAVISEPGVALVLLMLGVYGLLFEFLNPGFIAPGVIGGVCLLLAAFGLQMLPVNYAGLALVALGIAFLVAEAFMPSFGVLGLGGITAFVFGALFLLDTDAPGFAIPRTLIAVLAVVSAAFVAAVAGMAGRARQRPLVAGPAAMLGATGELDEIDSGGAAGPTGVQGWATIAGEKWRVRAATPGLRAGDRVRVLRADGLTLEVAPLAAPARQPTEGGP